MTVRPASRHQEFQSQEDPEGVTVGVLVPRIEVTFGSGGTISAGPALDRSKVPAAPRHRARCRTARQLDSPGRRFHFDRNDSNNSKITV
jgi:hypothetical protein